MTELRHFRHSYCGHHEDLHGLSMPTGSSDPLPKEDSMLQVRIGVAPFILAMLLTFRAGCAAPWTPPTPRRQPISDIKFELGRSCFHAIVRAHRRCAADLFNCHLGLSGRRA
jgi:hypothetical protein